MVPSWLSVRRRFLKMVGKGFPANSVRVRALSAAGYRIGSSVYVGEGLHITDDLDSERELLVIEDRVSIAQRVTIILSSHPNNSRLRTVVGTKVAPVRIEADAWIGAGAIILPGISIGPESIVGAGSVVTRSVPPGTVVAGNPARALRPVAEGETSPRD